MIKRLLVRKILVRTLFIFGLIVTLLFAAIAFENWRGGRAWHRYRTAAEARGEKLWLAQVVPPPVPDAENFAAIPLFQELFDHPDTARTSPLGLPPKSTPYPGLANPARGERFGVARWRDAFSESKLLDAPSDNAARDLLRALESFEPTLDQLREAAARPHSRFPVRWEVGFTAPLPHLGPLQGATRLFTLRMEAHLALGESAAAYADFRDGLQMYRGLEKEPALLCGLVRISMLAALESGVWDGLADDRWNDSELRALAADFAALRLLDDGRFALASERGGANHMFDDLAHRPERLALVFSAGGPHGSQATFADHLRWRLFPRGWLRENQIKINEFFDATLARLDAAGPAVPSVRGEDARPDQLGAGSKFHRFYYALAGLMMPAFSVAESRYLAAHTAAQQARTACALALHRRAHGTFPERLDELVPAFLESVPLDICDGAPLRYRRTEAGWELWSIGANRVDDGAKTLPKKTLREQPDWVWRRP